MDRQAEGGEQPYSNGVTKTVHVFVERGELRGLRRREGGGGVDSGLIGRSKGGQTERKDRRRTSSPSPILGREDEGSSH